MMSFEVTLMKKATFEGKKVVVQAGSSEEAFKKATQAQHNCGGPRAWATLTAKPMGMEGKSRFKHKGLRGF
jgi:hypothetical protein